MGDAELRASAAGVLLILLLAVGRGSSTAQHHREAAAGANSFLWELLLAEGLMLGPCLSYSPAISQPSPYNLEQK